MAVSLWLALGTVLVFVLLTVARPKQRIPLPPGPPSDPFIGHIRHIPPHDQGSKFHEWAKKFGDIISVRVFSRTMIVLDKVSAAIDLLDKRSAIYSDRPSFPVYIMMGWVPNIVNMTYGNQFRKHRKIFHSNFTREACVQWRETQTVMARRLVKMILNDDKNYNRYINWFASALTIKIAYGMDIVSEDDEYVKIAEESADVLNNSGSPGGTPIDLMPFLQHMPSWFPGTHYANFARKSRPFVKRMYNVPFDRVRRDMANGMAGPSVANTEITRLMSTNSMTDEELEDVKGAAVIIFVAGADTTWSTMLVFIQCMLLHPEVQKRAQEELDRVVGHDRLPEFSDYDSLPYLECVLREVLRWYPVAPLGVPHRAMQDDVYKGMFIPKGATVIANLRGMSLDEDVYKNPKEFNPSRFMAEPEGNGEPFFESGFGFGRRICPGRHLAYNSLWIAIATLLSTATISKALDKDGQEIDVAPEYLFGIVSRPKEFPCRIQSRVDDAMRLLFPENPE
ncbi:hypothetical protein HGRIS_013405 [Hohenbuehelia grisea]|uniref:Cytochrome P450 n=1 Tax=Hohenbuehelia grisea TaxID=104357 RepID=A0ABR3IVA7_9AGAR